MIEKASEYSNVVVALIGGAFTVFGIWLGIKGKNNKDETDHCLKALAVLEEKADNLKESVRKEREFRIKVQEHRDNVEGEFEGFKYAFNVFYDESESKFKDHPEHMVMMKSLKRILDK